MARDPVPVFVGESIHGQTKATLMQLHREHLERTIQSTLTLVDNDSAAATQHQEQQRLHNKKKKKYYPWIQRDSQNQRNKIGQEGSRRRQRHDNGKYKFAHHPFAVLYQVDLAFPGYDHDAPSFHWKYDAVIESMIRNNPPSSRRSNVESESSVGEAKPTSPSTPPIGHHLLTRAQRKDIKKVHVPKGVVMQYEGELVSFLDQLTLSDLEDEATGSENSDASEGAPSEPVELVGESESSDEDVLAEAEIEDNANWVLVKNPEVAVKGAAVTPGKEQEPQSASAETMADDVATVPQGDSDDIDEKCQIYLRWDIQDQFLRFVAHALCAFYGLVSFSKTALDGKRWVYICHPAHLDSIGQLAASPVAKNTPRTALGSSRPLPGKRQKTLEQVQGLPVHELDQLWNQVQPTKVSNCLRPDMTFFEYLYPTTRPLF
ncbi:hypothetical protein BGZ70_010499 [Mortierella alpina]|uniref:R3H-associated N-terminal domain-containing protein n=1 Tax=Mortierella alpina TaxID=64518 RepID=A0A9P6IZK0_MORAP|nr:hypothetical protein BGZ70_010499 [Mortierella alpina]